MASNSDLKKKKKPPPRELGDTFSLRKTSSPSLRQLVLSGAKVRKRLRENTSHRSFRLKENFKDDPCPLDANIIWFPWQLAVCPSRRGKPNTEWGHRKRAPGYYKRQLFKTFRAQRAIYEVGVQAPTKKKIYAVYYKGFYNGMNESVYKHMLSEEKIAEEVNDIVLRKGSVFIRRGVFTTVNGAAFKLAVGYIRLFYKYAWKSKVIDTGKHRLVMKRGFQISGPPIRTYTPKRLRRINGEDQTTLVLSDEVIESSTDETVHETKDLKSIPEDAIDRKEYKISSERETIVKKGHSIYIEEEADNTKEEAESNPGKGINEKVYAEYNQERNVNKNEEDESSLKVAVVKTEDVVLDEDGESDETEDEECGPELIINTHKKSASTPEVAVNINKKTASSPDVAVNKNKVVTRSEVIVDKDEGESVGDGPQKQLKVHKFLATSPEGDGESCPTEGDKGDEYLGRSEEKDENACIRICCTRKS